MNPLPPPSSVWPRHAIPARGLIYERAKVLDADSFWPCRTPSHLSEYTSRTVFARPVLPRILRKRSLALTGEIGENACARAPFVGFVSTEPS